MKISPETFRLVFIDLDGTLCDTHLDITTALNQALTDLNIEPQDSNDVKKHVGRGAKLLVDDLLPDCNEQKKSEILKKFLGYYSASPCVYTKVYDGVIPTLSNLSDKGLHIVCLTNKITAITRQILDKLGLSRYFTEIYGGDSFPEKKPSPVAINHYLGTCDIPREHALMVGDTLVDIITARNANCRVCCVKYGYSMLSELQNADFLIDNFSEILEIAS